jgi:hypothetical protein
MIIKQILYIWDQEALVVVVHAFITYRIDYCNSQRLDSSHMVIVRLVLQPPFCGTDCQQILEMRRLFKFFNLF